MYYPTTCVLTCTYNCVDHLALIHFFELLYIIVFYYITTYISQFILFFAGDELFSFFFCLYNKVPPYSWPPT